jgi:hypothetical protein
MGGSTLERQSQCDPSQNKNIKQFYVKTENSGKVQWNKEKRRNNEHDKIIQYFPYMLHFYRDSYMLKRGYCSYF